jgi:hypothetical protein
MKTLCNPIKKDISISISKRKDRPQNWGWKVENDIHKLDSLLIQLEWKFLFKVPGAPIFKAF